MLVRTRVQEACNLGVAARRDEHYNRIMLACEHRPEVRGERLERPMLDSHLSPVF